MKKTPLLRKSPMRRTPKPFQSPLIKALIHQADVIAKYAKPRKPLRPVSKKLAVKNVEYEAAVKEWWKSHDHRCEMMFTHTGERVHRLTGLDPMESEVHQCFNLAQNRPHHMKRRGKFLCDKSTFLGLCRSCHIDWLHNNEEEARRLGYLLDRPEKSS